MSLKGTFQKRLIFIRGALTNGAKVAPERQNVRKKFSSFKQQYLGNEVTEIPKMGLKLKVFAKT